MRRCDRGPRCVLCAQWISRLSAVWCPLNLTPRTLAADYHRLTLIRTNTYWLNIYFPFIIVKRSLCVCTQRWNYCAVAIERTLFPNKLCVSLLGSIALSLLKPNKTLTYMIVELPDNEQNICKSIGALFNSFRLSQSAHVRLVRVQAHGRR